MFMSIIYTFFRKLKIARKNQQLANVQKKQQEKEEHKQRSLAGMKGINYGIL